MRQSLRRRVVRNERNEESKSKARKGRPSEPRLFQSLHAALPTVERVGDWSARKEREMETL